jgi:hypothetical protein
MLIGGAQRADYPGVFIAKEPDPRIGGGVTLYNAITFVRGPVVGKKQFPVWVSLFQDGVEAFW